MHIITFLITVTVKNINTARVSKICIYDAKDMDGLHVNISTGNVQRTFLMENTKNSSGLKTINWENT